MAYRHFHIERQIILQRTILRNQKESPHFSLTIRVNLVSLPTTTFANIETSGRKMHFRKTGKFTLEMRTPTPAVQTAGCKLLVKHVRTVIPLLAHPYEIAAFMLTENHIFPSPIYIKISVGLSGPLLRPQPEQPQRALRAEEGVRRVLC